MLMIASMFTVRFDRLFLLAWMVVSIGLLHLSPGLLLGQETTLPANTLFEVVPLAEIIKEIQTAAKFPGGEHLAKPLAETVSLWIRQIHLGIDNVYSGKNFRYLAMRITILNPGPEPITVNTGEMTLTGWGVTYQLGGLSPEYDLMPMKVGREVRSMNELLTPAQVTVPPAKAAACWVVFTQLDKANVLQGLTLQLPLELGGMIVHDLRAEQKARLGIEMQRIGPAGALGLLSIRGELNTINSQDLADQLDDLSRNHVRRCLIRWQPEAGATVDDLIDWLLHRAAKQTNNELYAQFPPFPDFQFLALANLPSENQAESYEDEFAAFIYDEPAAGVQAALRDLLTVIDPNYVTREIQSGHLFSRQAALAALEDRQDLTTTEGMFPLLNQLYDTTDQETRKYVLLAIGQQHDPRAIPMLVKITERVRGVDATDAFIALLRSNQAAAVQAVLKMITDESALVAKEVQVELLAENFRREWLPCLVAALTDRDPKVRAAAVAGFVEVGTPQLSNILQTALQDSSNEVRMVAFAALVERTDSGSETIAVNFALKLLAEGVLDENVSTLITRTRDQRAAPILLKMIDQNEESRHQLFTLLEQVGDERSVRQLLQRETDFSPEERVLLYHLVSAFDLPERFEVAQRALQAQETELQQAGIAMLTDLASDPAAEELAALIPESHEDQVVQICYALGRIGTRKAEELLKAFRQRAYEKVDAEGLSAASAGLNLWMSHSPAWNAVDSGRYHLRVGSYDSAIVYFDLASEIDPALSATYSDKGNALLRLKRYQEAGEAFQRAYELDNFDGQAITGVGIIKAMQGHVDEAVELTESSAGKFPQNDIYAYNTACVYGRSIEYLKTQSDPKHQAIIKQYELKAIQALKDSIEFGFDEFDLMKTDSDLDSLRELTEFQALLRN